MSISNKQKRSTVRERSDGAPSTKRAYRLKRRAETQAATRQRIIDATVELHTTVGPSKTTISDIAQRAGVQRLTVYRHFPTPQALFAACTARGTELWPPPNADNWLTIADPAVRLERALTEVYAYYRSRGTGLGVILRDAPEVPVIAELLANRRERMLAALAEGWPGSGPQTRLRRALLGHALDFHTWLSLTERGGLTDEQAIEAMVTLVLAVDSQVIGRTERLLIGGH